MAGKIEAETAFPAYVVNHSGANERKVSACKHEALL